MYGYLFLFSARFKVAFLLFPSRCRLPREDNKQYVKISYSALLINSGASSVTVCTYICFTLEQMCLTSLEKGSKTF